DISDNVRYDNYSYFSIKAKSAPIQAPTNLKATTIDEKSINISWNAVTNAQSYNLYRDGKFLVNVKGSTQYKDSNLKPNKEYFYAVSSVYNGAESALSESVSAKTNKADHNIAIKSISPEVLELGENELEITFINDGKYEQDSRSTITLSCSNPNVTILTNNINLNALYAGGEATKYFKVMVGDVPTTTTIEFNANVAQKFAPYYSWDCPFEIMANVPTGVEDSECDDNITSVYISGGELYVNGIEGDGRIEFFDISGKALFSSLCHEGSAIINISKYKEGIYIVRVVDNNGVKTQKIYLK
ncbi:MAG: T9SS type A sorting domain-containing protein, partial [Muribaculaceae bacterium]|nr:T9SS type A sorting domain-containing protein [Muribaculaceae bacterium]